MNETQPVTVYTATWNEEIMMPHFIRHYRKILPSCRIVVYDNESTDGTTEIAKAYGCEVISYGTGNTLDDHSLIGIYNHAWKSATTDWVLTVDCDEFCEVDVSYLNKCTVVKFEGIQMVNMYDNFDVEGINMGVPSEGYNKCNLFNRMEISDINFLPGRHEARPVGNVIYNQRAFKLKHYSMVNPNYMISRYATVNSRRSDRNLRERLSCHYERSECEIRKMFADYRKEARLIL